MPPPETPNDREVGSSFRETARAELLEETGIDASDVDLVPFASISEAEHHTLTDPNGDVTHCFTMWFALDTTKVSISVDDESVDFGFFALGELPHPLAPASRLALELYAVYLETGSFQAPLIQQALSAGPARRQAQLTVHAADRRGGRLRSPRNKSVILLSVTEIRVELAEPPGTPRDHSGTRDLTANLLDRIDDVADAVNQVAAALQERLAVPLPDSAWPLENVELSFGVELQVETGVVVAKASASAALQVTVCWGRP